MHTAMYILILGYRFYMKQFVSTSSILAIKNCHFLQCNHWLFDKPLTQFCTIVLPEEIRRQSSSQYPHASILPTWTPFSSTWVEHLKFIFTTFHGNIYEWLHATRLWVVIPTLVTLGMHLKVKLSRGGICCGKFHTPLSMGRVRVSMCRKKLSGTCAQQQ